MAGFENVGIRFFCFCFFQFCHLIVFHFLDVPSPSKHTVMYQYILKFKRQTIDCKADTMWKTFRDTKHNKNWKSRIATVDRFVLFGRGGSRGRVQGVLTPPPLREAFFFDSLLKFVYLAGQWRHHSLEMHPLLRKILDSPLFGTHQHCTAKICNASPRANADELQSNPFTISSSVLWRHLQSETRFATERVSERKESKYHDWRLKNQKNKCGWTKPA